MIAIDRRIVATLECGCQIDFGYKVDASCTRIELTDSCLVSDCGNGSSCKASQTFTPQFNAAVIAGIAEDLACSPD